MERSKIKVLVTGANGYLGAGIYSYLKQYFDSIGTYHSTQLFPELIHLDITENSQVLKTTESTKPDYIIHIAANPSGKWCDAHPKEAVLINEQGTKNIVNAANAINAKVIYVSSLAAINPITSYGKTKLSGEIDTKKTKAGWVILQPSLIIGYSPNTTNDRPFNRFIKNITENTPAIYDTSWRFQPTELKHIAEVIQIVIEKNILNETIPISVPELKTRFEVAKDILTPFGVTATSTDAHDTTQILSSSQDTLKRLDLPIYTYKEIIQRIVKETKIALKK